VTVGRYLKLADRSGHVAWEADLGERAFLAGTGAFSPDGSRITILNVEGCLESCSAEQLAARQWSFSYLDTATGQPADGPDLPTVSGAKVRALGWSQGRDLVVVRHEPATPTWSDRQDINWYGTGSEEMGHATLLRLSPGGTTTTLLDPPDDVRAIDVPLDILTAGRFGGPPSHAAATPVRSLQSWWEYSSPYLCSSACLLLVVALVILLVRRWRRRARARAERPEV
jgi:hypothetical protein